MKGKIIINAFYLIGLVLIVVALFQPIQVGDTSPWKGINQWTGIIIIIFAVLGIVLLFSPLNNSKRLISISFSLGIIVPWLMENILMGNMEGIVTSIIVTVVIILTSIHFLKGSKKRIKAYIPYIIVLLCTWLVSIILIASFGINRFPARFIVPENYRVIYFEGIVLTLISCMFIFISNKESYINYLQHLACITIILLSFWQLMVSFYNTYIDVMFVLNNIKFSAIYLSCIGSITLLVYLIINRNIYAPQEIMSK